MTFAEVHVKWSVILIDRLGPDILLALWMKGQVLHRARAHLKVPGNLLIDSHRFRRHKNNIPTAFHSLSLFTLTNIQLNPLFLKNFKLLQNDPETGTIFLQPPLISFKRDKNIGNFLVRSSFQTNDQPGTFKKSIA